MISSSVSRSRPPPRRSSSTCSADAKSPFAPRRSAQYLSFPKASTVRPSAGMMYPEPLAYGTKVR